MIKFILPAILIFLIVLFWEKINERIYKKLNIKLNYILVSAVLAMILVIYFLVKN